MINEKCDVFFLAFGVLMVEIIMGKHPEDLVSSLTSPTYTMCDLLLKDVLNQQLSPPTNQAAREVLSIAKIAFACLHTISQSRPNNAKVSQEQKAEPTGTYKTPTTNHKPH